MTIRIGLCSVTFRALSAERVVALAAQSGLESIEWGGDVHVPPGDVATARQVAALTADAGLAVASYGSYFRAGEDEDITPVLDSASALGARRIRVWAGSVDAADATEHEHAGTIERLRNAAAAASDRGLELALEYHGGTLANAPATTLRVLDEVDHPALRTYWQPTVGATHTEAIDEYTAIADRVSAVHVFSWWPRTERRPLADRDALWRELFATASAAPQPPQDALLEFVPDDDPAVLVREASVLRAYRDA
ncbi:sugar phosphate isomerase/epimerase family protein [Microbacterium sp. GXF0217]